jgi:hypothetical protein
VTGRRGSRLCRAAIWLFAAAYAAALALFAAGTFGLAGTGRDPLAGVYLIPLGLPWNLLVDRAPEPYWPWLAALAPAANLVLLAALCRAVAGRRP